MPGALLSPVGPVAVCLVDFSLWISHASASPPSVLGRGQDGLAGLSMVVIFFQARPPPLPPVRRAWGFLGRWLGGNVPPPLRGRRRWCVAGGWVVGVEMKKLKGHF